MRILNLDRNECNILVRNTKDAKTQRRKKILVPIDHGLSFPDTLAICSYDLVWLSWSHAAEPFSEKTREKILKLKPEHDLKLLDQTFHFRQICLMNARISTILLIEGARERLTLEQIGKILCRPDEDDTVPSLLERIVNKSRMIADMIAKKKEKFKTKP